MCDWAQFLSNLASNLVRTVEYTLIYINNWKALVSDLIHTSDDV